MQRRLIRLRKQMTVTGDQYIRGGGHLQTSAASSDKLHQSRTSHIIK